MISTADKEMLRQRITANQHEIYILSLEEMDAVVQKFAKTPANKSLWNQYRAKLEKGANFASPGKDTFLLAKLVGDMGGIVNARAYIKYYNGKPHIILKGYPGLRKILTGTKYGVQNAKVVKIGLGKYGGIKAAKGGGVLTIILLSAYRIIDYALKDGATLSELIGSLATDVVKVGIATGASIAVATGAATFGSALVASSSATAAAVGGFIVAIGPLAAVVLVGAGMSVALTILDEKYGITDKVIAALDEISEKGISGIISEKKAGIVNMGKQAVNDAAESVIDYAVEKVERIVINTLRNLFSNIKLPQI